MRTYTIILSCAILVLLHVRNSDAVACSTTILTNCTDCTDGANAADVDCIATTTTTAASSFTLRPVNRKIVRISNLRYSNLRRVRVNSNANTGTSTNRNQRNRSRRNRNVRG